ncbi:hypothetical protein ERJ75_001260900 [Trypanosoma vivax]|nr:hypothetical protein ERJ75_001260900 [Trypanosoma vivax]
MQHHRHSGVNEVVRILPCTRGRATLDARRLLLLIGGDVERNPGPLMRGAQWNSCGPSQSKRVALERKPNEGMVLFRALQVPGTVPSVVPFGQCASTIGVPACASSAVCWLGDGVPGLP